MTTNDFLRQRMGMKGITRKELVERTGACDKTIGKYLSGITTSGPYLTAIMEVLEITVKEWNQCDNVICDTDRRKYQWESIKE